MDTKRLFEPCYISAPGRINLRLGGRFKEVCLYDLNDAQLEELYRAGCRYVRPTEAGLKKLYPAKVIENKKVNITPKEKIIKKRK